jgi:hypothetical protein
MFVGGGYSCSCKCAKPRGYTVNNRADLAQAKIVSTFGGTAFADKFATRSATALWPLTLPTPLLSNTVTRGYECCQVRWSA